MLQILNILYTSYKQKLKPALGTGFARLSDFFSGSRRALHALQDDKLRYFTISASTTFLPFTVFGPLLPLSRRMTLY